MKNIFLTTLIALVLSGCGGGSSGGASSGVSASSASSLAGSSSTATTSSSSEGMAALVPFVLPFDDASAGITNQAGLNHIPAGKFGPITVSEAGHFLAGKERIRFIGVNITAGSAFPSNGNAGKVARRLAKFGVNLVRFHHIDNNFGAESVINYAAGTSRTLNTGNLAKLDYFIAQLKAQGIYINLNLLNSRTFSAADGLPEAISDLTWKQAHVLGFVNDGFRSLEKEYAQQLLNHRNPYTGLTYAEDPAIAFVEINNENGFFQQYFEGSVDDWPASLRAWLDIHWNAWLATRYESTVEAEAAWDAIDEPLGSEKLTNADFSGGINAWNLEQISGAVANSQVGTYDGRAGLSLQVTAGGAEDWHVQFNQGGLAVVDGQIYTLGFWAKSADNVRLNPGLQMAYAPWDFLESRSYPLSNSWQYFETSFVANRTDNNLRINFNGFGNQLARVYLANVSFKSGGALGVLPTGESIEAGTVSSNYRALGYTPARIRDWASFMRKLETDYWADMNAYVKTTLAYSGLVAGTAIMNSPPSVQKQFDFADAHAYWQHPVFPGPEWDSNNWIVSNESMVNTINNTLGGLARQRIHGIPFTVSEYQHASPNTYGSEGPLLSAAYGALQDWDALIFFAYDAAANDNWGSGYFNDFFSMNAHPTKMANLLVAANLFRRGDVSPAQEVEVMNFDPGIELDILATQGGAWNIANGSHLNVPPELALIKRFALDVSPTPGGSSILPAATAGTNYVSDTGELYWNNTVQDKGVITVNSLRSKAVVGFINGRRFDLDNVTIAVSTTRQDWATVSLTLQEGRFDQPDASARLLVITTGLVENTHMQWKDATRTSLGTNWGTAPTLVEVIPATIDLPFIATNTSAWILDETGQRKHALAVQNNEGKARLVLTQSTASLWYEVVVSPTDE